MELIDYIDYREIFEIVKKNHLKEYPTVEEYIENMEGVYHVEDKNAREMYEAFKIDFSEYSPPSSTDGFDDSVILDYLKKDRLFLEFSIGGNDSNESGDNYWGYGHQFTISLDDELFIDYNFENYS